MSRRAFLAASLGLTSGCLHRGSMERVEPRPGEGSWPTEGFDYGGSGFSREVQGPRSDSEVLWKTELTGGRWSGLTVGGGRVYWYSADYSDYGGGEGDVEVSVLAADAGSGEPIWTAEDVGSSGVVPTYSDGKLYLNNALEVVKLDAGSGDFEWRVSPDVDVRLSGSARVVDGVVYTGVSALDASSGEVLWEGGFGEDEELKGSPAVGEGAVATVVDSGLYVLEAEDGSVRWQEDEVVGDVCLVDGVVYSHDFDVLYALDVTSGGEIWRFGEDDGNRVTNPAVSDDSVYCNYGGYVVRLDRETGDVVWRSELGGDYVGRPTYGPIVSGDVVYTGRSFVYGPGINIVPDLLVHVTHNLYALDSETGDRMWGFTTEQGRGGKGNLWGSPAVAGGVLYVGSSNDHVYALAEPE